MAEEEEEEEHPPYEQTHKHPCKNHTHIKSKLISLTLRRRH